MAINFDNPFDDYRKRLEEARRKLRELGSQAGDTLQEVSRPATDFVKRDIEKFKQGTEEKYGEQGTVRRDFRRFFGGEDEKVEANELIREVFEFVEQGGRQMPFFEQAQRKVREKGKEWRAKYPALQGIRNKAIEMGFKDIEDVPIEELDYKPKTGLGKSVGVLGSILSNIGQFYLAGKVSQGVLSRVGSKLVSTPTLAKPLTTLGNLSPKVAPFAKIIDPATGAVRTGVAYYLKSAVQWGLFTAPRLEGTPAQKTKQLASAIMTGGFFGYAGVNIPDPVKRYLADIVAPYIITRTIEGDEEKAVEDAVFYAIAGLPFLAGIKEVGKGPKEAGKALLAPGAAPAGGPPPPAVVKPLLNTPVGQIIPRITGVAKQTASDLANYLGSDKAAVRKFVEDIKKYGAISSLSDKDIESFRDDFAKTVDKAIAEYTSSIADRPRTDTAVINQMNQALAAVNDRLKALKDADTRQSIVLAIDDIMAAEHSRGGSFLTYGYGFGDIDRGDQLIQQSLDFLRDQTEFGVPPATPATRATPAAETGITTEEAIQPTTEPTRPEFEAKEGKAGRGLELEGATQTIVVEKVNRTGRETVTLPRFNSIPGKTQTVTSPRGQEVTGVVERVSIDSVKPTQSGDDLYSDTAKGYAKGDIVLDKNTKQEGGANVGKLISPDHLPPILVDSKGNIIDGNQRWAASKLAGLKEVNVIRTEPKTTVAKLEKERKMQAMTKLVNESKSSEDYAKRVRAITKQIDEKTTTPDLRRAKTFALKQIGELTGWDSVHWKQRYFALEAAKGDPMMEEPIEALEELLAKIDPLIGGGRGNKGMVQVAEILNLPKNGKYFIPYGKYSTRGTKNREWVQENIPLLYMGNKRGMMGYILDSLGIQQRDLGSISPDDVKHLGDFTKVIDLFGGSGLLSNLSKKFFPKAEITYNEFDPGVIKALDIARKDPQTLRKYVSQVGKYLQDNPGADWLAHFSRVYKEDENFRVAARLIEAVGGRTGEITPGKLRGLLRALPNFSKVFKKIEMTNRDALKIMDEQIKSGTKDTFLWIDPPYIWSTGYNKGASMERAEGFMDIVDKLGKLDKKGVKFVFFNNDPEVQVAKAGLESAHINNIMGKINELSKRKGVYILRDVNPIGAAERREIMITNLPFGKDINRFLNIDEVQGAIKKLKDDPAAAPREMLKLYRDLAGTSRYLPAKQRITPGQIKTIRELRKRLRIKNRTMFPILDQLLGDVSFAKMTREDGKKMIEWLQPANWENIEHEVEKTRDLLEQERLELAVGDRVTPENETLEEQFGVIASMNKTISEIDNLSRLIRNLPRPEATNPNIIRESFASLLAHYIPEGPASKLLQIKHTWHTPLRGILTVGTNHTNRMKKGLKDIFKNLDEEQRKYVVYKQAGAEEDFKGKLNKLQKKEADEVADYIQEIAEVNLKIVNNLRAAKGQKPLKGRKPYIPYIISEDLAMAADARGAKFWETRLKTPKDFAAGLFTHDPERIIDTWADSSGSWMKKNLYGALLMDRFEDLYKVSDAASAYARQVVEMDIYNMITPQERMFKSFGRAINKGVGSIYPKRVPVDEDLAKSILNTRFGKDLEENIKEGYLEIPRVQIPNIPNAFHTVYYPLKLAWNFGFAILNRTQPVAGLPFVGAEATVRARVRTWMSFFPWSKARKDRESYIRILEESGYEFGRMIAGEEIPKSKNYSKHTQREIKGMTVGQWIDRSVNFLADSTELANRLENMYQAEYFLTKQGKKIGKELKGEDKKRAAARFSAYINFLGGKGYSPIAQRNPAGRILYIFTQYPLNQIDVYAEMLKISLKDEGAAQFWRMMGREGVTSEEAEEFFNELPNKSKANVFLIALSIAIPIAVLYALSRNWNIAQRGAPSIPRVNSGGLIAAVNAWMEDPDAENTEKLKSAVRSYFSISSYDKLKDAFDSYKYGVLSSRSSGRPIFTDQNIETSVLLAVFGRSSLEDYEEAYPSWLAKYIGGQKGPSEVDRLRGERSKIYKERTKNAVEIMKQLEQAETDEDRKAVMRKAFESGMLDKATIDKLQDYMEEREKGAGAFERSVSNLVDDDQAQFIKDKLDKAKTPEKKKEVFRDFMKRGLITENVLDKLMKLYSNETEEQPEEGFFQGLFK